MIDAMQDDRFRLLALWHGLRRDVDALLEPLLSQGPMAVSRVSTHLQEIEGAVTREQAGFTAFRSACSTADGELKDDLARGRALVAPTADPEVGATVIRLPGRHPDR